MATKIAPISRAEPGADRNRTKLKAPATATPVPTFPLTIMITTHTTAGRIANVMTRLRLYWERHRVMAHKSNHTARETPTHSKKALGEMELVRAVSNNPANRESSIATFSFHAA